MKTQKTKNIFTKQETKFLLALKEAPYGKTFTSIAEECGASPATAGKALAKLRALNRKQKARAVKELGFNNSAELNKLAKKRKK